MQRDLPIDSVGLKVCSRCIYDERVAAIGFDAMGVCNYCRQIDGLVRDYGTGTPEGERRLQAIVDEIKRAGMGKKYDCVVGVSGGTDSSYMVYLAKQWGLRPLAVHYDNTWNTAIATQNIRKVLRALDVDLYTHVVDNKESDDIFRAFFTAGVAEIEAATDFGLAETMYRAASKYGVKYVLEGHSFVTEGITPVGRNYFDGQYIRSIHKLFGKRPMRSYPLMTFWRFIWWSCFARIRKIRPLLVHQLLEGGRARIPRTRVRLEVLRRAPPREPHDRVFPRRLRTAEVRIRHPQQHAVGAGAQRPDDARGGLGRIQHAADGRGRTGRLLQEAPGISSDAEYEDKMAEPPKSWREFPTYKKRFERLRPLFAVLARAQPGADELLPEVLLPGEEP